MIDLNKLKKRKAQNLLLEYKGENPYILKLKKELELYGKVNLTESQGKYIINNFDFKPILINRVIEITEYSAELLKKQNGLTILPKKILIEYILSDNTDRIHFYGKLKRNQVKSGMYYLSKTQLIDDPYFEPFVVDVNFEKYSENDEFMLSDGTIGRTPYEHQKEGIKFLLSRDRCILALDMGLGKMLASDTPVLTPDGWVNHGSLKKGDYVIGSNGRPTLINKVNPTVKKNFYNITLTDGTIVESCDEHLWAVQTINHKKRGSGFIVKQLKELKNDLTYGSKGNLKWYLPIVKPVEFNNKKTLIDPYLLGCLLGDGGITQDIILTSIDTELINECKNRLPIDNKLRQINETCNYSLTSDKKRENKITRNLIKYGLKGLTNDKKFIPEDYKYNSIKVRLEILQGLLDTNGYCSKKGTIEYYSSSLKLSNDVKELVQSLGGVARSSEKSGKHKKPDGTIVTCKLCYILTINLPQDIIPFKLKRKIDNLNKNKKYLPSRGIKKIEYNRTTEGQCISVEAKDSLYVMDQYVVTHNTYISIIAALESKAEKVLIICPSSLKINWKREIEYLTDDSVEIIDSKQWKTGKFTIINFDILKNFSTVGKDPKDTMKKYTNELVDENFDLVIVDEAHNLKNPKSIRGKILVDMCVKNNIDRTWLLTGTPIANRPMDYFNLLSIIKAPVADNWQFFAKRYCEMKKFTREYGNGKKRTNYVTDGASNLEELNIKCKNILLRRKKEDVLDMPDKTIITNHLSLTKKEEKEYDELWDDYLIERKKLGKRNNNAIHENKEIIELGLLRKYIALKAIPHTIKMAENAIEQGNKVIIFTNYTEELQILNEHFKDISVIHNGPMKDVQKQNSVDKFQKNDKIRVFIGNIKSAGVGITLTASNVVIFNSFDWVPGGNEQCEDRCLFGGQKILTNEGYKNIEDIIIGDEVYTHLGNFKKVINTKNHLERKKLKVDIDGFGYNKKLSVTNDHKIYVYDNIKKIFEWVEAENIKIDKHLLTFKSNDFPTTSDNKLIIEGVNSENGRTNKLENELTITNELMYAFGFYVADGWCSYNHPNKSSFVSICQKIDNKKMHDAAEYIIEIFKKSFKIKKHNSYIDKNNAKSCTIYSKRLAKNFKTWFGKNVYNKKFPDWVFRLSEDKIISLLEGYYHGDGYKRKNTQEATTVSDKLISQLIILNSMLKKPITLNDRDSSYSMSYTLEEKVKNKNLIRIKYIDGYLCYPIKSIKIGRPKRGEERVYDLSVEDDHSFVCGLYNVHNCYRIGQKNNVTVYYQLFLNTISERMWDTVMRKKEIISKIIGEEFEDNSIIEKLIDESL